MTTTNKSYRGLDDLWFCTGHVSCDGHELPNDSAMPCQCCADEEGENR